MKVALITGMTDQDGLNLAEFLRAEGPLGQRPKRFVSTFNTQRIVQIYQDPHVTDSSLKLHCRDLTVSSNLTQILSEVRYDRIMGSVTGYTGGIVTDHTKPDRTPCKLMDLGRLMDMGSEGSDRAGDWPCKHG